MITRKRKINQIPSTSVLNTNSKILVIHEGSTATISALDIISGISVISADHLSDFNNPHQVTKTQVGLSNVENTADLDKPISTSTQIALDSKQDTLVSGVNIKTLNGVPLLGAGDVAVNFPVTTVNTKTGNVVLDSTDIPEGANLYYTNARVESVGDSRYVSLAGSYGNPSWLTSIDWSKIDSKPSTLLGYNILDPVILATGNYINPSWIASIDFSKLTSVPLFATQLDELSDVQIISPKNSQVLMYDGTTWRNADNLAETKLMSLTDVVLTSPSPGDLLRYNGTVWLNTPSTTLISWGDISGSLVNQTDLQTALSSKADSSALSSHITATNNPHSVTKAQVGLSNVDNTSDLNKPISNATQAALAQQEILSIAYAIALG